MRLVRTVKGVGAVACRSSRGGGVGGASPGTDLLNALPGKERGRAAVERAGGVSNSITRGDGAMHLVSARWCFERNLRDLRDASLTALGTY